MSPASEETKIKWSREIMASVVVFLVALPLCMGIAIASGVPPALGLVTGIVGGLVVGAIAGAPLQVSGPAAGLTVLVWQLVEKFGLPALGLAVLLAGGLQMAAGLLKLGRWFRAVSPALIAGMLAGIGVLILASQIHVMIDDAPRSSGLANLVSIPGALIKSFTAEDHRRAAVVGIVTVAGIVVWNWLRPEKLKSVPGALVGVVLGTLLAHVLGFRVNLVAVPSDLVASLNVPPLGTAALLVDPSFLSEALGLALIASAETLLCAAAIDRMATGVRTNYDRELFAQGVGNTLCGLVGALPMTGVIVRSAANVEAGAKTRLSAILHGAWLLALVVVFPSVLSVIPTAALAAILVYTGYRLANPPQVRKWWALGRGEAIVFVVTVFAIVATNLLTGVVIGIGVSLLKLLNTFAKLEVEVTNGDDEVEVAIHGAATFVKLPVLANALETLPSGAVVHLHVGGLTHVDHACLELLKAFQERYEGDGGKVIVDWDDLAVRSAPPLSHRHPKEVARARAAASKTVGASPREKA
jgi:MFS superfamily sulfate permease-like transporter